MIFLVTEVCSHCSALLPEKRVSLLENVGIWFHTISGKRVFDVETVFLDGSFLCCWRAVLFDDGWRYVIFGY